MGKRATIGPKWEKKIVYIAPYLRNHTSYDCHLWYTSVKWYLQRVFFHFFKILIFQVVSWVKEQQNGPKWQKFLCLTPYLRNHTSYDCGFCLCVKWCYISPIIFFIFSKFWILGFYGGGVKGKEIAHNYTSISQEL